MSGKWDGKEAPPWRLGSDRSWAELVLSRLRWKEAKDGTQICGLDEEDSGAGGPPAPDSPRAPVDLKRNMRLSFSEG